MNLMCFDLEGVLTPEVWIAVSKATNIEKLKLTTRDISDYDLLMKNRIKLLRENQISLEDIQKIISGMDLIPGAKDFLTEVRKKVQVIIITDSFIEFVSPFMQKLNNPLCFCHELKVDEEGMIADYRIRIPDMKRKTIQAMKMLNYETIVAGDSYNDIPMLIEAKHGILFRPPQNVIQEYPQFPVTQTYPQLKELIYNYLEISE